MQHGKIKLLLPGAIDCDRRESHTFIQGNRSLISFKHGVKRDATEWRIWWRFLSEIRLKSARVTNPMYRLHFFTISTIVLHSNSLILGNSLCIAPQRGHYRDVFESFAWDQCVTAFFHISLRSNRDLVILLPCDGDFALAIWSEGIFHLCMQVSADFGHSRFHAVHHFSGCDTIGNFDPGSTHNKSDLDIASTYSLYHFRMKILEWIPDRRTANQFCLVGDRQEEHTIFRSLILEHAALVANEGCWIDWSACMESSPIHLSKASCRISLSWISIYCETCVSEKMSKSVIRLTHSNNTSTVPSALSWSSSPGPMVTLPTFDRFRWTTTISYLCKISAMMDVLTMMLSAVSGRLSWKAFLLIKPKMFSR
jgi:hypothetical protein